MKNRVEFSAVPLKDSEGEGFVPLITIYFGDDPVNFTADVVVPDIETAGQFVKDVHDILSGKYGMENYNYDKNGNIRPKDVTEQ